MLNLEPFERGGEGPHCTIMRDRGRPGNLLAINMCHAVAKEFPAVGLWVFTEEGARPYFPVTATHGDPNDVLQTIRAFADEREQLLQGFDGIDDYRAAGHAMDSLLVAVELGPPPVVSRSGGLMASLIRRAGPVGIHFVVIVDRVAFEASWAGYRQIVAAAGPTVITMAAVSPNGVAELHLAPKWDAESDRMVPRDQEFEYPTLKFWQWA